jgi:glyoxylase-like metal-dependent hydrolase (beta-lactamase superfamily II)
VKIDEKLVRNADNADVNRALAAAFLPPDVLPVSFTVLLVNTGSKLVMIDAGTAGQLADTAGVLLANLAAAGIAPAAIDMVVISHFHPDHINGLKTKDGAKVFPNAEILVPEPEWSYWMDDGEMDKSPNRIKLYFRNARRIFSDITGEVRRFKPGAEVAPGITSIPAFGHTPGHCAFAVASSRQSMLVMSDSVRNPYLFARHPDWQPLFDMDGPLAVKTRRQMLDRAAADRMLVQGYHFPFPACGHIARNGKGYELVPAEWRPLL